MLPAAQECVKKADAMGFPDLVSVTIQQPPKFIFTVETTGALKPEDIVFKALDVLRVCSSGAQCRGVLNASARAVQARNGGECCVQLPVMSSEPNWLFRFFLLAQGDVHSPRGQHPQYTGRNVAVCLHQIGSHN